MDDDNLKPVTSQNDEENTETKYAEGIYDNGDDIETEKDLNSHNDDLDAGLGDDAYGTYDADDSTLTAENDSDETETGMGEVDADDINPEMDKMGDVVLDADDEVVGEGEEY